MQTSTFEQAVRVVGLSLKDFFHRMKRRLMDFTECQLATAEDLRDRAERGRYPKGRAKAQADLAREMVDECFIHLCTHKEAEAAKCLRLADELKARGQ